MQFGAVGAGRELQTPVVIAELAAGQHNDKCAAAGEGGGASHPAVRQQQ